MHSASESEKKEATELRRALEQQMDQLRDAHQKQVAALRDEISEKQQLINDLKEYAYVFQIFMSLYLNHVLISSFCVYTAPRRSSNWHSNNYKPITIR